MAERVNKLDRRVTAGESIQMVMDEDLRKMLVDAKKDLFKHFDAKAVTQNEFQSASFDYLHNEFQVFERVLQQQKKRHEELEEKMSRIGLHQPWLHQPLQPTEKTNVSVTVSVSDAVMLSSEGT